jgi:hypothetical protein
MQCVWRKYSDRCDPDADDRQQSRYIHASAMMPVMMAADARTIAIWETADASPK